MVPIKKNGDVTSVFIALDDITTQKEIEKELKRQKEEP